MLLCINEIFVAMDTTSVEKTLAITLRIPLQHTTHRLRPGTNIDAILVGQAATFGDAAVVTDLRSICTIAQEKPS